MEVAINWKVFFTIFTSVFIAELGDKTQIATMLFASNGEVSKWLVFASASLALIVATAIGVVAGTYLADYIDEKMLAYIAGAGFIIIGIYTIYSA